MSIYSVWASAGHDHQQALCYSIQEKILEKKRKRLGQFGRRPQSASTIPHRGTREQRWLDLSVHASKVGK
jgi:hypothetical protein